MLIELGEKYGTDKVGHGYIPIYEKLFSGMRTKNIQLMEIGVLNGASVKMWEDYFIAGHIYGVDINEKCREYETQRTSIIIEDATKLDIDYNLDIIIDDGSHNPFDFVKTFSRLWAKLKPGGYYCIEDLSVIQHPKYPQEWVPFFMAWFRDVFIDFLTNKTKLDDIDYCELHPKLLVVRKKSNSPEV